MKLTLMEWKISTNEKVAKGDVIVFACLISHNIICSLNGYMYIQAFIKGNWPDSFPLKEIYNILYFHKEIDQNWLFNRFKKSN